ncbi:Copia protein-like protein [Drosera capensis]
MASTSSSELLTTKEEDPKVRGNRERIEYPASGSLKGAAIGTRASGLGEEIETLGKRKWSEGRVLSGERDEEEAEGGGGKVVKFQREKERRKASRRRRQGDDTTVGVGQRLIQKEEIDYYETFVPISKKDSLRIILVFVAHFDMKLHQMDVKTELLNRDLEEKVYIKQPEGFLSSEDYVDTAISAELRCVAVFKLESFRFHCRGNVYRLCPLLQQPIIRPESGAKWSFASPVLEFNES